MYTYTVPILYVVMRLIFKRSFMFQFALYAAYSELFACFMFFWAGQLGVMADLWAVPIVFFVGLGVFIYLGKIFQKPLEDIISQVKKLSDATSQLKFQNQHQKTK